jgi:hypothetical protein
MADRYPVSEKVQIGVESTAGTNVVPTIELQGMDVQIDTAIEYDEFGPMGMLTNTLVAPRQEWGQGSLSGYPTYTEIQYPLSNIFGAATISTPSGATNARQWLWAPDESTPWTPKTWTIRRGVPGDTAEEAGYALLSGLNLSFSRTATPEIGGDLFARRLDYTASLATTGLTSPSLIPILPAEGDVWLDSAGAGLGTTKLLRDFAFSWSVSGLFGPIWPINSSLTSFAAHGVRKPTLETVLRLGNDTAGRALLTNMRAGSSVFVRFKATSSQIIEASTPYSLQIDLALKCISAPSRGDEDGLLSTLEYTFRNVYDATWTNWARVTLITNATGL